MAIFLHHVKLAPLGFFPYTLDEAHIVWRTLAKCEAKFNYCFILRDPYFGNDLEALHYYT
jgi:hypothetical protein